MSFLAVICLGLAVRLAKAVRDRSKDRRTHVACLACAVAFVAATLVMWNYSEVRWELPAIVVVLSVATMLSATLASVPPRVA